MPDVTNISKNKFYYLKGMVWSSFGNITAMVASLGTIMFAVRLLAKEEIGAFYLVLFITGFAACLGDIGFRNTAIKFLSIADKIEIINATRYFSTISFIASTLACFVLTIILPFLTKIWISEDFHKISWYCIPIVLLMINFQMGSALLVGYKMFNTLSIVTATIEILRMSVSILFLYLGYGTIGLLLSLILSRIIGIGIIWYKIPCCAWPLFRYKKSKEIFSFSGWMYGTSVMSIITVRTADTLLTTYLGTATLATYSTAMQIPSALQKIFESVKPVILGYVSTLKMDAANASVAAVRLLSGLLAISVSLLVVLANPLVSLLFSSRYTDSVPIMQALCIWTAIGIVNYFLSITLIGMGCGRKFFVLTIPQFFTMLLSSIILIPKYQGMGAAISLIITSFVGNIAGSWLVSDGNSMLFHKLIWAFLRSSLPLLLLFVLLLTGLPSIVILIFLPFMITILFISKAITPRDIILSWNGFFKKI
ncbi:MAG: oligosaccharide flippase family protein [Bacteroidia bacterium]|nr:oligosaccharide flippase family protein [Bacteroidia bacterium]